MRFLGIDYGAKRVGLALSDPLGKIAFPHQILDNDKRLIPSIKQLCEAKDVGAIVVGHSLQLSGKPNPVAAAAKRFAGKLAAATGLKIHWQPEWFTTQETRREIGAKRPTDAAAAAFILKGFLERRTAL